MPTISRTFIKAGLLYFVMAAAVGLLMAINPYVNLISSAAALRPVFYHLLMVGWVTQLIIGVAVWMFPKFSKESPRGSDKLSWAVFYTLNLGLILRLIFEPLAALNPQMGDMALPLTLSAALQLASGWMFVLNVWPRVKER